MVRTARSVLVFALCTLLLAWPLVVNRGAVPFPDTFPYISSGERVWATVGKLTHLAPAAAPAPAAAAGGEAGAQARQAALGGRSPYYGAFGAAAMVPDGFASVALIQSAWLALVLLAGLGRLGIGGWERVAAVAAIAALTSLPFFAAVVMPDVFAGVAVLALTLLVFEGAAMGLGERGFWALNLLLPAIFHSAILVLGTALLLVLLVLARRRPVRFGLAGLTLGVAAAATMLIGVAAQRLNGRVVQSIPFLLARVIGDGTGATVLREDCPRAGWVSCRFVPALPLTENDFLWDTTRVPPWYRLADADRQAVAREQKPILVATLQRHPGAQVAASVGNFFRQLVNLDLRRFGPYPFYPRIMHFQSPAEVAPYLGTLTAQRRFPLAGLTTAYFAIYAVVTVSAAALLVALRRRLPGRTVAIAATLLGALLVSAATTGVLVGPIGRYQARISWLALLALIVIVHALRQARRYGAGDLPAAYPGSGVTKPRRTA